MKSGSSRTRANYSPVRQMNYQHGINYNPTTTTTTTTSSSSSSPSSTSSKRHHHHHLTTNPNETSTSTKPKRSYLQANENKNDIQPQEEEDISQDLEEVYLCDCCGITRQLKPAMKYMALFSSAFFLFNFLVFAFGLANLAMGLWFRIDPKVYEIHKYIETQNFTIAGWLMLFGGTLAILMSLVGCTASARQAISALLFYLIVMVMLTLGQVASVVLLTIFGLGKQLESFLVKEIYEQIRRRAMSTEVDLFQHTDAAQFLDFVQVKMRCCGATSWNDYLKLGMVVPTSCYAIAGNLVNAPGCGRAIRELMDIRAGMATAFTAGATIVQLLAILLASLMICSIYNWRARPRALNSQPIVTPTDQHERHGHQQADLRLSPAHLKQLQQPPLQHERPITSIRV